MAERRMFSKKVTETDRFLDMPLSAQALYFHLGLYADDDGFVGNPTTVQRLVGASKDDLKILISKGFLIAFASGVVVITHWGMSNKVQKDRYHKTIYNREWESLKADSNGAYLLGGPCIQNVSNMYPKCIQDVSNLDTEVRLGKDRLVEDSKNISAERSQIASVPEEAPVEIIPLNDGSGWRPTLTEYQEYVRLYPSVDVDTEFRKMRAWCIANPTKRKTKRGVRRFVTGWLGRTQDDGRGKKAVPRDDAQSGGEVRIPTAREIYESMAGEMHEDSPD